MKLTVYVPDELKGEMDKVEAGMPGFINWSGVAQVAFQRECALAANRKKGAGKMKEVIERLRASKERINDKEFQGGHAWGRKWAMEQAQYDELERVAKLGTNTLDRSKEIARTVMIAIYGDVGTADACGWEFFDNPNNPFENPSDAYVRGFHQGAKEVFDEVADKL